MENVSKKRFYSDWQIFQVKATWKDFLAVVIEPSNPKGGSCSWGTLARPQSVWMPKLERVKRYSRQNLPRALSGTDGRTAIRRRFGWVWPRSVGDAWIIITVLAVAGRKNSSLNGSWSDGIMALREWKCYDKLDKNISPRVGLMKHFLD